MCDYVARRNLKEPKSIINDWIKKVQKKIKKEEKIHFSYMPIGSGKRNMVIKQCNRKYFDLDFQIMLTRLPKKYSKIISEEAKEINDLFKKYFDDNAPEGFSKCQDSTQALTSLNSKKGFSYDIIITRKDDDDNYFILYNKKNTNNANNRDYWWAPRSNSIKDKERMNLIRGPEMWNDLRERYKKKRHDYKDCNLENKKKSYQILNEAVVETLECFDVNYE